MMNKRKIFKIGSCISLILAMFSSVVFGATYDSGAMDGRQMVYDDAGNAYVAYGEPVVGVNFEGTGLKVTENYQDANGNLVLVERKRYSYLCCNF